VFLGWDENEVFGNQTVNVLFSTPKDWIEMEKLVERELAEKTEVLAENLPRCQIGYHKSYIKSPRTGTRPVEVQNLIYITAAVKNGK
jgi:hypothetical protein